MSDKLAEAERLAPLYERNIRRAAQGEQLHDLPASLLPLLAEYDRLKAENTDLRRYIEEDGRCPMGDRYCSGLSF